jgi:hypothetical protein
MAKLPKFFTKKVNLSDPLGGLSVGELTRPGVLAYEDGYADGREYGINGKFIPSHYTIEEITQYAAGFSAGVKVREHISTTIWSTTGEVQEATLS